MKNKFLLLILLITLLACGQKNNSLKNESLSENFLKDSMEIKTKEDSILQRKKMQEKDSLLNIFSKHKTIYTEKFEDVEMTKFSQFKISERWIFENDKYGWHHYRDAFKGEKFATALISFKSQKQLVNLPSICFYEYNFKTNKLEFLNTSEYEYYYGDWSDNSNSFLYKETVKFSVGCRIPEKSLNLPIFIIAFNYPSRLVVLNNFEKVGEADSFLEINNLRDGKILQIINREKLPKKAFK